MASADDPPRVVQTGKGVAVAHRELFVLFTGRTTVRCRPWPTDPEAAVFLHYVWDDLIDAGVSPFHPFLQPCPNCGAYVGEGCRRRGKAVSRWCKARQFR